MVNHEIVHLFAGGIGGTVAALITCPLEVVKVRLQSASCRVANVNDPLQKSTDAIDKTLISYYKSQQKVRGSLGIFQSIKLIIATEGRMGLFKGVGPTLVGVIPSRSVYFSSYTYAQTIFNQFMIPESSGVYFFSAAISSAISSTITNPIWYVKTRLQLDFGAGKKKLTVWQIIKTTFQEKGIPGFYRGVTASYAGISETGINFMIYENLKVVFLNRYHEYINANSSSASTSLACTKPPLSPPSPPVNEKQQYGSRKIQTFSDTFVCMGASMVSKSIATTIAYPHEVARTRLREDGNKYRGFFQTIGLVFREEGYKGLYRGLMTHYLRQVPNTCIMMGVYEGVLLLNERLF